MHIFIHLCVSIAKSFRRIKLLQQVCAIGMMVSLFISSIASANNHTQNVLLLQKQYLNQVNQCSSIASFSRLINVALKPSHPNQISLVAMTVEEMILNNPTCFVEASVKLGKAKCELIEDMFIREPHFNPRDNLKESLASTRLFKQSCFAS